VKIFKSKSHGIRILYFPIVVSIGLLFSTKGISQQLSYKSTFNIGIGNVYSKISTVDKDHQKIENGETVLSSISSGGRNYGISIQMSKTWKFNNSMAFILESSVLHARRKGKMEETHFIPDLFLQRTGALSFNNLYGQIAAAPRLFFGMFRRAYVQAGPYWEANLANFSRYRGNVTQFYSKEINNNNVEYALLSSPLSFDQTERIKLRNWDFGAMVSIGTQLSLPGKDIIEVELRYARGSFSISEYENLRQNRVMIILSYAIVNLGYHKSEKYFH